MHTLQTIRIIFLKIISFFIQINLVIINTLPHLKLYKCIIIYNIWILNMIINNKDATIGLPIYLIIAIISATAVITLLILSMYYITMESQIYQVENEIQKIITESENMFEYADQGTFVTIHVEFPDSMKYVVFGDLPRYNNVEPKNLTLNENTSNNYYFIMNDGTLKTFHSNVRFCGNNTTITSLFYPGIYDICLELTHVDGKTYVKIY